MNPYRKIALLLTGIALAAGCKGGSHSNDSVDGGAVPLSECLSGWYLQPPNVACTSATCGSSKPPPECSFNDCTQWSFEGFQSNGVYHFGLFSYSAHSMSMSGLTTNQTWVPTTNGYTISQKSTSIVDWCTTTQMSANKDIVVRPPANLSAALDQATAGGATSWTHVPVGP